MFENPRRGRQARNFTTNAPKILDLKSSSEQIFSRKLPLGVSDDSSFAVQFSISVSKRRAILLFKIKIKLIEMFELHERMPGMRSAEYQATIPLKFS